MKKILSLILAIFMLLGSNTILTFANEQVANNETKGYTYSINNGLLVKEKEVKELEISTEDINVLNGTFYISDDKVTIDATYTKEDKKNKVIYYMGTANYQGKKYLVDIVKNDIGMSGLMYDESRTDVVSFAISKKEVKDLDDGFELFNKEFKRLNKNFKPNNLQYDVNEASNIGILSTPVKKTLYNAYDGWTIPFVISAGSVEGTFYYTKGLEPEAQFYAEKIYGVVNWNTGFDSLAITNENETYGHLYATPACPPRVITTWTIDKMAYASGQYTFDATVSYSLIVKGAPVLFWDSKEKAIY